MKDETLKYYADSYILGNGEFKKFMNSASKLDVLNMIEILESMGESRHKVITRMRTILER